MPKSYSVMWMEIFMYVSWLFVFMVSVENFVVLYLFWRADPSFLRSSFFKGGLESFFRGSGGISAPARSRTTPHASPVVAADVEAAEASGEAGMHCCVLVMLNVQILSEV